MKIIDISVLTNFPGAFAMKNSVETAVVICDFVRFSFKEFRTDFY